MIRPAAGQPALRSLAAIDIFSDVMVAMQGAEEIGGPEGDDYIALMDAIATEARQRIVNFRAARVAA